MTDEEIIAKYRLTADEHWMGMLYERYAHLVLGVCFKYLQNEADAQDMACEIFMSLFHKLKEHEVKTFRPWLYTLSRNQCLMVLRKKGFSKVELNGQVKDDGIAELEMKLLSDAQQSLLESAIEKLPLDQQHCIVSFYLKKKSYQQIADTQGYTIKQVKSHLQNGKRNLRIALQQHEQFHVK